MSQKMNSSFTQAKDPEWDCFCVDHAGLLEALHQISLSENRAQSPRDHATRPLLETFQKKVDGEIASSSRHVALTHEALVLKLKSSIATVRKATDQARAVQEGKAAAEECQGLLERLARFVESNHRAVCDVKDRCVEEYNLNPIERKSNLLASWVPGPLLVLLSKLWNCDEEDSAWVPPASFQRTTSKYLVKREDVLKVKLAFAKHLPVLVVGDGKDNSDAPDDALLSSIYLDTDDLRYYKPRLGREEGCRLFRLRWYGSFAMSKTVYVERKTHHTSWSGDKSIKERFPLPRSEVDGLLQGSVPPGPDATALERDVRQELADSGVSAVLRTLYYRTAFQSATKNRVRISLDTMLTWVPERDGPRDKFRNLDGLPENSVEFGYAVLEVKLLDEAEPWLQDILATLPIQAMPGFSKFIHGTALFTEVPVFPYWMSRLSETDPGSCARLGHSSSSSKLNHCFATEEVPPGAVVSIGKPSEHLFAKLIGTRSVVRYVAPLRQVREAWKGGENSWVRPPKIEPKTFFANERTFVQWLQPGVVFLLLAQGLLPTGMVVMSTNLKIMGTVAVAVGILLMTLSFLRFGHRTRKIVRRDPAGYQEHILPYVVVLVLTAMGVAAIVITFLAPASPDDLQGPNCGYKASIQRDTSSIEGNWGSLTEQPSGLYHEGGNKLLLASGYEILGIDTSTMAISKVLHNGGVNNETLGVETTAVTRGLDGALVLGARKQLLRYDQAGLEQSVTIRPTDLLELDGIAACPIEFCPVNMSNRQMFWLGGVSNRTNRRAEVASGTQEMAKVVLVSVDWNRGTYTPVEHIDVHRILCRNRDCPWSSAAVRVHDLSLQESTLSVVISISGSGAETDAFVQRRVLGIPLGGGEVEVYRAPLYAFGDGNWEGFAKVGNRVFLAHAGAGEIWSFDWSPALPGFLGC